MTTINNENAIPKQRILEFSKLRPSSKAPLRPRPVVKSLRTLSAFAGGAMRGNQNADSDDEDDDDEEKKESNERKPQQTDDDHLKDKEDHKRKENSEHKTKEKKQHEPKQMEKKEKQQGRVQRRDTENRERKQKEERERKQREMEFERLEKQFKEEQERIDLESEKRESERIERERKEFERKERERKQKEEQERLEFEKRESERIERERKELERKERERKQKEEQEKKERANESAPSHDINRGLPSIVGSSAFALVPNQNVKKSPTIDIKGETYLKINAVGKGGTSVVYRVLRKSTMQMMALKQVEVDDETLDSYSNEIKILQSIPSKSVIQIFDYEVISDQLFILMELGDIDLNTFLSKYATINEIRVIWQEMLEAVQIVHNNKIVHGDLKPANFVFVQGRLKIIDFGLAKKISSETTNIHRECSAGTPNYLAPEAIELTRDKPVKQGRPSDVWSLGCIAYQLFYKRTPFSHIKDHYRKAKAIIDPLVPIDYPSLSQYPNERAILRTLQSCLQRDPKKRPTISVLLDNIF